MTNNTLVYGPDLAMDIEGWALEKHIHLDDLNVMWLEEVDEGLENSNLKKMALNFRLWCSDNDFYEDVSGIFEDLQYSEIRGMLWEGEQQ